MNPQTLLAWWNLIFVVPFGLALLYLGLYAVTGLGIGEVDGDADADIDHDVDVDHDADLEHDADVESDADADADHDADTDHDAEADTDADGDGEADHDVEGASAPLHAAVLGFLGVGHVPVGFLVVALLMTWGATGFIVNQFLGQCYGEGPRLAAASAPAAALVSLLVLRAIVTAVRRWLPLNASSARRRHELLGSTGTALFEINGTFGLAAVRDDRGELYQVPCRVEAGAAALPKGARVLLVAYSGSNKSFFVRPAGVVAPGAARA
jgi:hypothetical protein